MQVVDRIGKYRIVARLGEGAFGEVYRAEDPVMDRQVAIKIINAEGDSRVVDSFRREAATTARLRHKNIVTVYDYGDHEGNPFLAMELLEGETFASIIARAADLTTLERLEMLTQVGEGLHYAHAQRVVHCDIKPANLMRLTDGSVKILDFGVSRVIEDLSARRTRRRESAGTVLYMAPEQFEGMEADVLTDVFSYGVVCYELLAGTHPFAAAENSNAMYRIASQRPVPLRERWPSCPEQLEAIVERALHRNRRMRYPGAGDICVDLQDLSQGLRVEES
jgi:eukaryotic-like serine/threonine-protein kinase